MSRLLFLSHSGIDTDAAAALKARILAAPSAREHGLGVWFDKDDLQAGEPWQSQLEQAIGRSHAFAVYVGSKGVVNWVEAEVRLALNRTITAPDYRFVPILAGAAPGPDALPGFAQQFQGVFDVEGKPDQFDHLMRAVLGGAEAGQLQLETDPFFGLRAIDESRSHLFFGREQETEALVALVHRMPLVLVTGDSGSGKSSLVRAGLVPRFRGGGLALLDGARPEDTIWHVVTTRPRNQPFRQLGDAVDDAAKGLGLSLADRGALADWAASGEIDKVRRGLRCDLPPERVQLLLVVDQFEELLTITPPELRAPFIDMLLDLSDRSDGRHRVVLTMRHDYANLCNAFERLKDRLDADDRRARFLLGRMSDEGLRRIVTEPLRLAAIEAADREALASQVLRDVGERPGDLALVQMALTETWRARSQYGGDLLRAYAAVGRVEGALAQAAERVWADVLDAGQRELLDSILLRLVRLGDTGGATRRGASRGEFDDARWSLIQKLASEEGKRLLLLRGSTDQPTVEIAHEALVTAWPYFQNLLQQAADDKRVLDTLIPRAQAWAAQRDQRERDKRRGTGADLELFAGLLDRRATWLSGDERGFVEASVSAEQARELLKKRVFWGAIAAAFVFLASTVVSGVSYWEMQRQRQVANAQAARATTAEEQALRHNALLLSKLADQETDAGRARHGVLLALEAIPEMADGVPDWLPSEARASLERALYRPLERLRLSHGAPVRSAAFSADGSRVATASFDGTARIWDAASGEPLLTIASPGNAFLSAAFSPDGTRIVTASSDDSGRIWDAASGEALLTLEGISSAAFSPDGARILTTSPDDTARICDAASGEPLLTLEGHGDAVLSAAFSADGARVVTASADRTVRIWDAASGEPLLTLEGRGIWVSSATFSPDGSRVVTASEDGIARIWDAASGEQLSTLEGHGDAVLSAAFSPDGARVVTASDDGTARIWDAANGKLLLTLEGHRDVVLSAAFSVDGVRVVTASADDTARIWDAVSGRPLLTLEGVVISIFSPDGARIITAFSDNTARIWDAASGKPLLTLKGHGDAVVSAAFSADGARVVTASTDRSARIWDAASGEPLLTLEGHGDVVRSAAFSPDGARVVTASADDTARIWDAVRGRLLLTLDHHDASVFSAEFSGDGARVVTASFDGYARVWDAASGEQLSTLKGHGDAVLSAAFSPDGARIVTASWDDTARIWDAASGEPLLTLEGHGASVESAAFSADGARVVTASANDTARIWDATSGRPLLTLEGHGDAVLSAAFSPDGARIVTASSDGTSRIWKVMPDDIRTVVAFARSLNLCPLSDVERRLFYLESDPREWVEAEKHACGLW